MIANFEEFDFCNFERSFLNESITIKRIVEDLAKTYNFFCKGLVELDVIIPEEHLEDIANLIRFDLKARVEQDPIALSEEFIYNLSRSFKVIFYYRLAHHIFNLYDSDYDKSYLCKYYAYKISEFATNKTCVEIHPQAKIGKSFVIDHGVNTIIGATSVIGDNCTILDNVLLGALKITNNPNKKRHPTIGNNVCIACGVRILGDIKIGDNVSIGPDCLIKEDVLNDCVVMLERKQIINKKEKRILKE